MQRPAAAARTPVCDVLTPAAPRAVAYAQSADPTLQREVAERLANEAVKRACARRRAASTAPADTQHNIQRTITHASRTRARAAERQVQIVELDGLKLLLPLTESTDVEVQRLAAHALANLRCAAAAAARRVRPRLADETPPCARMRSVNADNQVKMAKEGGLEMLIKLLKSSSELVQRQSAKALANLGVNADNKALIAEAGGIVPLIALAKSAVPGVRVEAIAALANLAVNGASARRPSPARAAAAEPPRLLFWPPHRLERGGDRAEGRAGPHHRGRGHRRHGAAVAVRARAAQPLRQRCAARRSAVRARRPRRGPLTPMLRRPQR